MLFPRGKGELFALTLLSWGCRIGWEGEMRGANLEFGLACSESHVPCGPKAPRRELTPVRLCSVRLSWRQRARPSTTLHEIQICRSRLEYIVCTTGRAASQPVEEFDAEVVSTTGGRVGVLGRWRVPTWWRRRHR